MSMTKLFRGPPHLSRRSPLLHARWVQAPSQALGTRARNKTGPDNFVPLPPVPRLTHVCVAKCLAQALPRNMSLRKFMNKEAH